MPETLGSGGLGLPKTRGMEIEARLRVSHPLETRSLREPGGPLCYCRTTVLRQPVRQRGRKSASTGYMVGITRKKKAACYPASNNVIQWSTTSVRKSHSRGQGFEPP